MLSWRKYSGLSLLVYLLAYFSVFITYQLGLIQTTSQGIVINTLAYLLGAVFLIALYLDSKKELAWEQKKSSLKKILGWGIGGVFLTLFIQNIALLLEQGLLGESLESQNTADIITSLKDNPIFLLAIVFGAPIMEEFIFRRIILGSISHYSNFFVAALASSLLFAVAHADSHLLLYGFMGLFFAFLYEYTGTIWTPILTHIGLNLLTVITYLPYLLGI